ncbi:MAG TPA: PAS domain S-box protein [Candidatus Angelobacter sp.]
MRSHWPGRVALSAGVMVCALGAVVLVGWHVHWTLLIQVFPALAPMHHTTALSFLLSGIALVLAASGRRRAAAICAALPLLLAATICLEYAAHADFGIDRLLGSEYIKVRTTNPGRMSPVSAICFISLNASLLAMSSLKLSRRLLTILAAVASAVVAVGAVSVLAFLLGHADAYGWGHITRISMDSAAGFVLLGAGVLALAGREKSASQEEWLPLSAGLGLAAAVLGIWQALMQHTGEEGIRLLSGIILAGGLLMAVLVALLLHAAQQARRRSRELRQSTEGFRRVFEESPAGLALVEKDGQIVKANSALCRMVGYSEAELTGMSFREITHPDDPSMDANLRERLFNEHSPIYEMETRYLKKTGEIVWARVTASVIHNSEGDPLYGLATIEDITERRRAEAELDLGNKIIAHMKEGVCLVRLEDRVIVHANPKFARMFGYEPEELVGKYIAVLNAAGDSEKVAQAIGEEVTRSGAWSGELLKRRKDGTTLLCAVSIATFRHPEFGLVGVAIHRDITKRKRAEQRLRDQAALLNLAHDAIIVRDMNYKITFWNRGATEVYGWTAEQAQGRDIRDIIPTKFPTACNAIEAVLEKQEGWEGELEHTTRDGRTIVMASRWSLLRDEQNKPWAILQINRDVTARKRSEEHRRGLSERLSLVTRVASIGVWDWDLRSDSATWDETLYQMFGIQNFGPMSYAQWARWVHPEDLPRTEALLQRAIRTRTQYSAEFRIIRPDGSLRHISAAAGVVLDEDSNVIRLVGTAVDVTDRKRMEAQIESGKEQMVASARLSALGMMAGGIAHEINNPLGIIHALASDLVEMVEVEDAAPPQVVLRNSIRIRETADRIARIVKSLRQISREGSRDTLHPVPVSKILEDTLEICRERFRAHSVKLFLPEAIPEFMVSCREVQIAQVLLNLLQNAFDAVAELPGERWVRLEVATGDDAVVISVTDSGPGIPPELRSRIMEPFFTTKAVGKGTGLGLSLSKTIAEEHGGKLVYGPDQGRTRFSLTLPLARQAEAVWN